jgi:hypothetical protein
VLGTRQDLSVMKKLIAAICAAALLPSASAALADDTGDYYSYTDEGNTDAYLTRPLPSAWTNAYVVPAPAPAPTYGSYSAPAYEGGYSYPAGGYTYPGYGGYTSPAYGGYTYPAYTDEIYASWVRYGRLCRQHARVHRTLSGEQQALDDQGYYNFYQRDLTHAAINEQHARYHYSHPAADACMTYPQYQTYWYGGGYRY